MTRVYSRYLMVAEEMLAATLLTIHHIHAQLPDRDRDPDVRMSAARALGKIKDARAVEMLINRLVMDSWHGVRVGPARALGGNKKTGKLSRWPVFIFHWNPSGFRDG